MGLIIASSESICTEIGRIWHEAINNVEAQINKLYID
jgi:hypothetical protein